MTARGLAKTLRRRQLDRILASDAALLQLDRPRHGWLHEIRNALGMTGEQLASRLGVRQSTVAKLERAEQEEVIALKTLRNAAKAMGCELVYALVPRPSLEAIVEQQALLQAARLVGRVDHTMGLEGQAGNATTVNEEVQDLAAELVRNMSPDIWRED